MAKDMQSQSWTNTRDLRVAAALGSLGVVIKIDTSADARSGNQRTLFILGLRSLDGRHDTKLLVRRAKVGALQSQEPTHEFLTGLRAMQNREMILDLQKKGSFLELQQVPGTEIWQYVPGCQGLPGLAGQKAVVETCDLKVVAAAGLVGARLLKIEGSGRDHRYTLPRWGPVRQDGKRPVDLLPLLAAWRTNKEGMDVECPFTQGAYALWNRERLLNAVNGSVKSIVLKKDRTLKSAVVREDAGDGAFEKVAEFFDE